MGQRESGFGSLMLEYLIRYGVQYGVYLTEVGLLVFLLCQGAWRRLRGAVLYLSLLLVIDGVGRPCVLYGFGLSSREYAYFYWLTDVVLTLGAFLLVCAFFRRACVREEKMWRFLRLLLAFVFVLILGISVISLSRNYTHLFTRFIVEFQQNLYFTCLVLNTLLYILMQQIATADDELSLLVCGMGIQFAGPAACLALLYLTSAAPYSKSVFTYVPPLCTLGMLLTWFYAVARAPRAAVVGIPGSKAVGLAEAATREA